MSNYTREELVTKTATMNQMRNNLYHFLRFLSRKGLTKQEIRLRLNRMGKNIAETIMEVQKFTDTTIEETIMSIYSQLFESKVEITHKLNQLLVEDKKCPLCRYKRKDLGVSPCEVITSLVVHICTHLGYSIGDSVVDNSVALGNISCIHSYQIMDRDI
jgi:hypothetical protein